MPTVHNVIAVRRQQAPDGSHEHVTGVWVQENDGPPYTPRQVAESIREGELWLVSIGGAELRVHPIACPHPGCKLRTCLTIRDSQGRDVVRGVRSR